MEDIARTEVAEMPNLVQITNFSRPWILMALPTNSSLVYKRPPSPTHCKVDIMSTADFQVISEICNYLVDPGGVEKVDTQVECLSDGFQRLFFLSVAIKGPIESSHTLEDIDGLGRMIQSQYMISKMKHNLF